MTNLSDPCDVHVTEGDLMYFCRAGQLFEAEAWLKQGESVSPFLSKKPPYTTPLSVAIDLGFHSLIVVLLKYGYPLENEPTDPVRRAIRRRRSDIVAVLLSGGARVYPATMEDACSYGCVDLIGLLQSHGLDLCSRHALAKALIRGVRPMLGVVKGHLDQQGFQREVDIALCHYAKKGSPRWISLLLWAGADPWACVPDDPDDTKSADDDCWNAVQHLVFRGDVEMLRKIALPHDTNFDELLSYAANANSPQMVRYLVAKGANPSAVYQGRSLLVDFVLSLEWACMDGQGGFGSAGSALEAIQTLLVSGTKWDPPHGREIADVRAALLKIPRKRAEQFLVALDGAKAASDETWCALLKTPSIKAHLGLRPVPERGGFRCELNRVYHRLKLLP